MRSSEIGQNHEELRSEEKNKNRGFLQRYKLNVLSSLFFLFLFGCFFYMIQSNTPLQSDDFHFHYRVNLTEEGKYVKTYELIESTSDWLTALKAHWLSINGRLSDWFVITQAYFFGKSGFAIVNTIVALISCLVYVKLCFGEITVRSISVCLLAGLIILSDISNSVFWMSGACNYLWGALFFGITLLIFNKAEHKKASKGILLLGIIMAVITSAIHEAIAVTSCGMFVCYAIYKRLIKKEKVGLVLILFILASMVGCVSNLTSPGLWIRINRASDTTQSIGMQEITTMLHVGSACSLVAILLLLVIWREKRHILDRKIFYFILCNIGVVACLSFSERSEGVRFYLSLGVAILVCQVFANDIKRMGKWVTCVAIFILTSWATFYYQDCRLSTKLLDYAIEEAKHKDVVVIDTCDNKRIPQIRQVTAGVPYHFHIRKRACLLWNREPFIVVFNSLVPDRKVYKIFRDSDDSVPQVRYHENMCYIRLPKGIIPYTQEKLTLEAQDGGRAMARTFIYGGSRNLFSELFDTYVRKMECVVDYSSDFDGKYHYIILTPVLQKAYTLLALVYEKEKNESYRVLPINLLSVENQ